eukprot:CAMPEP_0184751582 /NCGR_PEP_ID=MMETSP0315-20130426/43119_1 /TAXON_ID=101924 /ORGANISM="Rhodosorus marinus, Strain UTEX LB 2760" /LENGTH=635 /DNA_ID=CAMNT_0027230853 /DNA_START=98 /DNA_END=2006 /DNA_ORIENTATION=-
MPAIRNPLGVIRKSALSLAGVQKERTAFASGMSTTGNSKSIVHGGAGVATDEIAEDVPPRRTSGLNKPTVWTEFTPLARATSAINLGQGFPDWPPPAFFLERTPACCSPGSSDDVPLMCYSSGPLKTYKLSSYYETLDHAPARLKFDAGDSQSFGSGAEERNIDGWCPEEENSFRVWNEHNGISKSIVHRGAGVATQEIAEDVPPRRTSGLNKPTVWTEFTPLARATSAINLGQGFPDWPPPAFVARAAADAFQNPKVSIYASTRGNPRLLEAITRKHSSQLNRKIKGTANVLVTVGASEGIFLAVQSFVEEGDEVVVIEPAFDLYFSSIQMANAVARYVPLRSKSRQPSSSSELHIDMDELESALSQKTKLMILNSPHNPTGKVFTQDEMQQIARVLRKYPRCLVLSDEVYEHLTFDGAKHVPFAATEPDMWDRTISLYTFGKTFCATGWKLGWAVGPSTLMQRMVNIQQHIVFCVSNPIQEAAAEALEVAENPFEGFSSYYEYVTDMFNKKKDKLLNILRRTRLVPVDPEGGLFIMCNTTGVKAFVDKLPDEEEAMISSGNLEIDPSTRNLSDYNFCRWLTMEYGITPIPPSPFYAAAEALEVAENPFEGFSSYYEYVTDMFNKKKDKLLSVS